jgi:ABC-type transporter MlaC component
MRAKKNQDGNKPYAVGDEVRVELNDGRVTDATVRAVVNNDGEQKLQVDYGHEETALIGLWQIVRA